MIRRYTLTATEEIDGTISIASENTGFDILELLGILDCKRQDIYKQAFRSTEFIRKAITEDGTELIVDKEDEEE